MSILTFDLGQSTGYCIADKNHQIIKHGWTLNKPSRFQGGGMQYLKFRRMLDEFYTQQKLVAHDPIKEVYFEEVRRHLGTTAAHVYGGFLGVLTMWCVEWKIPYQGIGVQVIKKHVAGTGKATKEDMKEAVSKRLGKEIINDDEADAIGIMYMYLDGAVK